jgi:ribosomal protein L9
MRVTLKKDVAGTGRAGEVTRINDSYASRLIGQGKALPAAVARTPKTAEQPTPKAKPQPDKKTKAEPETEGVKTDEPA